jgi:hypothetical protein
MTSMGLFAVCTGGCGGAPADSDGEGTATTDQAVTPLGSHCLLHAWEPNFDGAMWADGAVECSPAENFTLQVCLQQLVTGGWQTVAGSCQVWTTRTVGAQKWMCGDAHGQPPPVSNRYYRTWIWGDVNGVTNTYVSSGVTGAGARNNAPGCIMG